MLGRFRSALYSAIGTPEGIEPPPNVADLRSRIDSVNYANGTSGKSKVKYAYQRPIFLQLFSDDEIQVTADHMVRNIHYIKSFLNFTNILFLIGSLQNIC